MPRTFRCAHVAGVRRRLLSLTVNQRSPRRPVLDNFFCSHPPRSRNFAHKSPFLLVSRNALRPQLPFLHPASARFRPTFAAHISRLISTEAKARWRARVKWTIKFYSWLIPALLLGIVASAGVKQAKLEHEYPTPRDWSFWSRWRLRLAQFMEKHEDAKVFRVLTDWDGAGYHYKLLLQRLENEKVDGQNVIQ